MYKFLLLIAMLTVDSCHSQSVTDNIVLVNVGNYDKGRIAKLISKTNALNPKVISLDIAFPEYTGDNNDKSLYRALLGVKKLVMPSEITSEGEDYQGREIISVYLTCAAEFFVPYAESGFVSTRVEESQIRMPKQFIVWQKTNYSEDVYHHFSVVTAMTVDSLKAVSFIEKNERLVDVDFKDRGRLFKKFSHEEVLSGKVKKEDIEGKIVIMGFLGPGNQDKFISPFSTNPDEPDMYGVEYLANIVAQVLEFNR
jgi:CHASE2 domain-containing sensor protein